MMHIVWIWAENADLVQLSAYVRKWIKVYELRHDRPNLLKALREATRGFVAIADVPGNHFIEELQELYPEAKVVDVNRDPVKWWASLENVINKASPWWLHYFLLPMPGWRWFPRAIECMTQRYEILYPSRSAEYNLDLEVSK